MAKFKSKHIKVLANVVVQLVSNDVSRLFLEVQNYNDYGTPVRIDNSESSVNVHSAVLQPGKEFCLNLQASDVAIWCLSDQDAYINVIEVVTT